MAQILKPDEKPIDPVNATMNIAAELIPSFRIVLARERGIHRNILVRLTGGIGDNVCAEPAIRFALNTFKDTSISIASDEPEIFQHLEDRLLEVWNTKVDTPNLDGYLVFDSFHAAGHLSNEFLAPPFVHCVDYPTLNMWRAQIPMRDRCVQLVPTKQQYDNAAELINESTDVVIHPGRTWPSRTMPKDWWDNITRILILAGKRPVIIGNEVPNDVQARGTIAINTEGCLDLRDKLSIMESVAILQRAKVLITNDSAPLHFAASGDAWIAFLSTVRHPEIITHYRNNGEFGWRMKNFAKGGVWESFDFCPSHEDQIRMDIVRESLMQSWLPDPSEIASWAIEKVNNN